MKKKYIFVTGGVVSSLGKGIFASSIAALLKENRINVNLLKFDPYMNVDSGTMNPFEHGEVYVTEDGAETDLDLGHYERFTNIDMKKNNNVTSGQIYSNVIFKEREGKYLGSTVQVVPHITDEIKAKIHITSNNCEVLIVEVGGTVGDIESLPFLESIRQFKLNVDSKNIIFIHLTLVPFISINNETKTKPTQHSVRELRSIGIQPDILICRSENFLTLSEYKKISLFTNIEINSIFSCKDMSSIYEVPLLLKEQKLDKIIIEKLNFVYKKNDLCLWKKIVKRQKSFKDYINIAIVGKYTRLSDAYKSIIESIVHSSIKCRIKVNIKFIDSRNLNKSNLFLFNNIDGILIPGGFGNKGIYGKIIAAKFARENKIPYFGICLGMQVAIIEFAKNVLNINDANSVEFDMNTSFPIVDKISNLINKDTFKKNNNTNYISKSMRLGSYKCYLIKKSLSYKLYNTVIISERHRHKYEINSSLIENFEKLGLIVSARSYINNSIEIMENINHPWFLGCQFHPEFKSRPNDGHPLFNGFIKYSLFNKRYKK